MFEQSYHTKLIIGNIYCDRPPTIDRYVLIIGIWDFDIVCLPIVIWDVMHYPVM